MKIESLKQDKLKHEYKVTVDDTEIQQKMEARLAEIAKTVRLKGFRPGKAPLNIVRAQYGDAIKGEVLERAVNDGTVEAINKNKLRPAMQPKVEVKSFEDGKGLEFTMAVEVLPEIKLSDFKKISVTRRVAEVADKEINEAIDRIAQNQKSSEEVTEKRSLKKGDIALIDFDGKVDGERRPGMKGSDFKLELGSGSFIDTFEDQLIGKKAGDEILVKVTFPENYGAKELAGKKAEFDVNVKAIHAVVTPKIDDEFAKKLGFDDVKALKEAVKSQIKAEYDQMTRMQVKRDLLDELDKTHDFDLPHGMVHAEEHNILHQAAHQMGVKESEISESDKKEYAAIAARRVKLGLVLAEVGRENKIEVKASELQQAVIREAQKYPGQEQRVFEVYQKNPQALESLKAPLFEDKVVDFILEIARIVDNQVSIDELMKDLEDEGSETKPSSGKKGGSRTKSKSSGSETKSKAKAKTSSKKK